MNEQLLNLNRRLQTLTITDDLTGLFNRRQAVLRLEEHWAMCDRYGKPLSVLNLDIDHFKRVNDTYGHAAGDQILRGVADVLRGCVRSTDIACRTGGEEFLVILPSQTLQEAEVCAERCRQAVAATPFPYNDQPLRATVSIGISTRRPAMAQCVELLKEPDAALYAAKQAGRNTTRTPTRPPATTASPPDPPRRHGNATVGSALADGTLPSGADVLGRLSIGLTTFTSAQMPPS